MSKAKIAWVISNIDRWQAFEWSAESFDDRGIIIDYYLLSREKGHFFTFIKGLNNNIQWYRLTSKLDYIRIIAQLSLVFKRQKYDVVHCHFLDANICGLTAAYFSGILNRMYTRHHSTFHHKYAPKGIYLDKFCNFLSTDIIAITKNVKNLLIEKEYVNSSKIHVIHHGFNFEKITYLSRNRVQSIAKKYAIENGLVIGVVSRFVEWKGIQYIIPAFKRFLHEYPSTILVLANSRGNYSKKIQELLKEVSDKNYRLINFERDVYALFKNFDIFIHTPVDEEVEAFGQIYVESMALGIPSVFTKSGIGKEIMIGGENCLEVPHMDSNAIYDAIVQLAKDATGAKNLSRKAIKTVNPKFGIEHMVDQLLRLYQKTQ